MEGRRARIVFAGGGTGGHLYPALAVAEELKKVWPDGSIAFVGARRGLERRIVPAAGYPLLALRLGGLKGAGLVRKVVSVLAAGWAVVRCVVWMLRRRPDLVIGVGGYASGPAVLAARLVRTKTMVLEQNHFPGATNRWLAPRVDAVCVPSEDAARRLRGRSFVTGTPVRPEFTSIGEREPAERLSLLVFGGSRGARSINRAMTEALGELARLAAPPRVVHQTGADEESAVRRAYAGYPEPSGEVRAFLDDMPERLAAADLVVSRAGASTIAELCAAGRAAILIPYPHAADDHQRHNAETLVEAGAAVLLADEGLDGRRLAQTIGELSADPARRQAMARAARALARPDAAQRIVEVAAHVLESPRLGRVS